MIVNFKVAENFLDLISILFLIKLNLKLSSRKLIQTNFMIEIKIRLVWIYKHLFVFTINLNKGYVNLLIEGNYLNSNLIDIQIIIKLDLRLKDIHLDRKQTKTILNNIDSNTTSLVNFL